MEGLVGGGLTRAHKLLALEVALTATGSVGVSRCMQKCPHAPSGPAWAGVNNGRWTCSLLTAGSVHQEDASRPCERPPHKGLREPGTAKDPEAASMSRVETRRRAPI